MASSSASEGLLERGTPPSYAGNRKSPPPYQSLFDELKDAKRNSAGKGHYLKSVCDILTNTSMFVCIVYVQQCIFSIHESKKIVKNLLAL